MPADPEIHDKLGEVIGLAQAVRLIVRELVARIEPEVELELAHLLERLALEVEEMQRRCDSYVASSADLKQSRVTAKARAIKASTAKDMRERVEKIELLSLLVLAAEEALVRWRVLAALVEFESDSPMASLATAAILLHEAHVQELARHLR